MIRGIVSCVPKNVVKNEDDAFIKMTGVRERRIATNEQDVLTLGFRAAVRLLDGLGWTPESIGAIVFVTQTPTVRMPCMAAILAGRMGLTCAAFDIGQACAGYVMGLWVAETLAQRVLLIVGDTVSKMCPPDDKLFGDCVTATALENTGKNWAISAEFGTDGTGWKHLVADPSLRMNGVEVMNFALRTVPPLVRSVTMNANVDYYLFHMANEFILKQVMKKCSLPEIKVPMNISRYGNTSSASIPLLMADSAATEVLKGRTNRIAMIGFGAGFTHAGIMLDLEPLAVCEVVEV